LASAYALAAAAALAAAIFLLVLMMKNDINVIPPMRATAGRRKIQTGSKKNFVYSGNFVEKKGYNRKMNKADYSY